MKTLFFMSVVCALMSLVGVLATSAMTIVPRPGAETDRAVMMSVAGGFAIVWLCLAFWARPGRRAGEHSPPSSWLMRILTCAGLVYLLGVFIFIIG